MAKYILIYFDLFQEKLDDHQPNRKQKYFLGGFALGYANFWIGMELGGSKHVERVQVVKECLVPKVCQLVPN